MWTRLYKALDGLAGAVLLSRLPAPEPITSRGGRQIREAVPATHQRIGGWWCTVLKSLGACLLVLWRLVALSRHGSGRRSGRGANVGRGIRIRRNSCRSQTSVGQDTVSLACFSAFLAACLALSASISASVAPISTESRTVASSAASPTWSIEASILASVAWISASTTAGSGVGRRCCGPSQPRSAPRVASLLGRRRLLLPVAFGIGALGAMEFCCAARRGIGAVAVGRRLFAGARNFSPQQRELTNQKEDDSARVGSAVSPKFRRDFGD